MGLVCNKLISDTESKIKLCWLTVIGLSSISFCKVGEYDITFFLVDSIWFKRLLKL